MLPQLLLNYTLHCIPGPPVAGACDYPTVLLTSSAGFSCEGIAGIEASLLRPALLLAKSPVAGMHGSTSRITGCTCRLQEIIVSI